MKIGVWIDKWKVPSSSRPGVSHIVARSSEGVWGCSCEAWRYRRIVCSHIVKIKSSISGTSEFYGGSGIRKIVSEELSSDEKMLLENMEKSLKRRIRV